MILKILPVRAEIQSYSPHFPCKMHHGAWYTPGFMKCLVNKFYVLARHSYLKQEKHIMLHGELKSFNFVLGTDFEKPPMKLVSLKKMLIPLW